MNLPDLIERAKKACPGWTPPCEMQWIGLCVGHGFVYGTTRAMMTDAHAAALILASIKEWCVVHRISVSSDITHTSDGMLFTTAVGDSEYVTAPTEVEALIAALEADRPKEQA